MDQVATYAGWVVAVGFAILWCWQLRVEGDRITSTVGRAIAESRAAVLFAIDLRRTQTGDAGVFLTDWTSVDQDRLTMIYPDWISFRDDVRRKIEMEIGGAVAS